MNFAKGINDSKVSIASQRGSRLHRNPSSLRSLNIGRYNNFDDAFQTPFPMLHEVRRKEEARLRGIENIFIARKLA